MKRSLLLLFGAALMLLSAGCQLKAPAQDVQQAPTATAAVQQEQQQEDTIVVKQNPVATIEMENGGTITVELYYDKAPNTVKNFIYLANSGFYDGVIFHRVIPGFMIQGGDPDGLGTGGPGYRIKGEFTNNNVKNDLSHARGVISMARQGNNYFPASAYNTAGSQFFIMHADYTGLDGDYAAFGMVTEGMDVVDAIAATPTETGDRPVTEQKMKSVRVETFGVEFGEPERIYD